MASIIIPAENNAGATNHCLNLIAGLGCPCRRGKGLAGIGVKRDCESMKVGVELVWDRGLQEYESKARGFVWNLWVG